MPEGRKARHQFDVAGGTVVVELENLLRGQRGIVAPGLGEVLKQIGVLDIELPFVDLVAAQAVGHLLEVAELGHTAAGAIEVIAAVGHVRPILNLLGRQRRAFALDKLAQRLDAVAQRLVVAGRDRDPRGGHGQGVAAGLLGGVDLQVDHAVPCSAAQNGAVQAGFGFQCLLQHLGIEQRARRGAKGQADGGADTEGERPLPRFHPLGFW